MRIGNISSGTITRIDTGSPKFSLEKGTTFSGKVVSIQDGKADILLLNGRSITARISQDIQLPLDVILDFEVTWAENSTIFIKPSESAIPLEHQGLPSLLSALGIKPDEESISFVENGKFQFGKNINMLMEMLKDGDSKDLYLYMKNSMLKPDELAAYMKDCNVKGQTEFLKWMENLFNNIKGNSPENKMYLSIAGNMLKGIMLQATNNLPITFIPIPLFFNSIPYPGEIWIEQDSGGEGKSGESLIIRIFADTPSGRIEASIGYDGSYLNIGIYCPHEISSLFTSHLNELKESISALSIGIKSINVSDLKESTSFTGLAKKYVKPLKPVNIKV